MVSIVIETITDMTWVQLSACVE